MKNIIYLLIAILLGTSCSNMLDLYPHSSVAPESVTEKDLAALERGMYNRVQNAPSRESWILFDILGGTLTATNSGNAYDLIQSVLSPLNSIISKNWSGYYSALFQVNNVIDITEKLGESATRNRIKGSAHYFRAYIYYCLITRWGGIPIIRKNTQDLVYRDSPDDVWKFIEEELQISSDLLTSNSDYYHVSMDAVTALWARVKLSTGQNEEAAELAESLIENKKYGLDDFEKIFRKKQNSEIIFAFENNKEESSNDLSNLFYTYAHPQKGSWIYSPAASVMQLFDEDKDTRKAISIDVVAGNNCINKYPSGQGGTDPVIISRLAEMYLISAEAKGRTAGLHRLNELRVKRGLSAVYPTTDEQYLDAILLERKKELLAEGFLYYDLVRTNRAIDELKILSYQTLLPIPSSELRLNPNLDQNPNY